MRAKLVEVFRVAQTVDEVVGVRHANARARPPVVPCGRALASSRCWLLGVDGLRGRAAEATLDGDVLRVRGHCELSFVLAAPAVRQRADERVRRGDVRPQRRRRTGVAGLDA